MADKRVRITARDRGAVEDKIPYPGTLNQPERKFKTRSQYDNWEEVTNHPLPDLRHDWQSNPRDEIGFGVPGASQPSLASVRTSANKAVRLAILLLGEKVAEEVVEDQARDFMGMSQETIDRSLARFSETQELYVAEDKEDDKEESKKDDKEESKDASTASEEDVKSRIKAEIIAEEAKKEASEKEAEIRAEVVAEIEAEVEAEKEASKSPEEIRAEIKAEVVAEVEAEKEASKNEEEIRAEIKAEIAASKEESKDASTAVAAKDKEDDKEESKEDDKEESKDASTASEDAVVAKDDKEESKKDDKEESKDTSDASKDASEEDVRARIRAEILAETTKEEDSKSKTEVVSAEEPLRGPNELDIELTSSTGDLEPDIAADERLAACFEDTRIPTAAQMDVLSASQSDQKVGIKKLGGQPKVAAQAAQGTDISALWGTAPDVSEVFV